MKIKKEVKAALMMMLICTSVMTGCQSNKDVENLTTEETSKIEDTINDEEQKESKVAETDPIDKDTSSNTSSNKDKDTSSNTSSNTSVNKDKDTSSNTSSNTSVNKDKDTSSNTNVNIDKNTSSNTSVNTDKNTSSDTSANVDKNTSSNTNVNTDKNTSSNTNADTDKNTSSNTSNQTGIQDGTYSINASLSGGAGKVSIQSPVEVTVSNGQMTAKVRLSSKNYTYMLVNGTKYYNVNSGGNSTFIIPISINKSSLNISAETVAMSEPHVIDYTINFDFSPIKK